jgi:hypothetical protein
MEYFHVIHPPCITPYKLLAGKVPNHSISPLHPHYSTMLKRHFHDLIFRIQLLHWFYPRSFIDHRGENVNPNGWNNTIPHCNRSPILTPNLKIICIPIPYNVHMGRGYIIHAIIQLRLMGLTAGVPERILVRRINPLKD